MSVVNDEPTKKELREQLMALSSNCCCVCYNPFIHAHHIDKNDKNDIIQNLAPLCPNHHALAHTTSTMFLNLTPERIIGIRDRWYEYVEARKKLLGGMPQNIVDLRFAKLKVKNFDRFAGGQFGPDIGYHKTFASLVEEYRDKSKITKDEIIDRAFSTTNPDQLKTLLQALQFMYKTALRDATVQKMFRDLCNAFGFDYDGTAVL